MRFGSLFAGIGGLDLALESMGHECAWHVEIDPFCQRILQLRWPQVQQYSDVTKFCRRAGDCVKDPSSDEPWCPFCNAEFGDCECAGTDQVNDECGPVEMICGGFPCQDISQIGKGAGLEGKRSGLWFEFARIVGELGPRFVFVENVSALSSRGLDRVLGGLSDLGYDAEWDRYYACDAGAPQLRARTFILAHLRGSGLQGHPGDGPRSDESRRIAEKAHRSACESGVLQGCRPEGWWAVEPSVGRVAHGVPRRVDRIKALGNSAIPGEAVFAFTDLYRRLSS